MAFLESPLGGLDSRTPRQAIKQGQAQRVIELAAQVLHSLSRVRNQNIRDSNQNSFCPWGCMKKYSKSLALWVRIETTN
ncbi:hypothetical protein [Azohydromonas caseinilytica]|uniref:Uncharacterized protein n=1 Tax=Azohydromonas caseinilytica TaxID=2728836 RepID=A0A848F8N1_9BURK|nr:hypothetical protein [Azohydromonas caseinilytica]NML15712.1 hypothetical protein [Azohydromonas caseinilytica]